MSRTFSVVTASGDIGFHFSSSWLVCGRRCPFRQHYEAGVRHSCQQAVKGLAISTSEKTAYARSGQSLYTLFTRPRTTTQSNRATLALTIQLTQKFGGNLMEYLVIGAGPAGVAACLLPETSRARDYLVLEAGSTPGTFFSKFPRHRELISSNKRFTGTNDPEFNLRMDWKLTTLG